MPLRDHFHPPVSKRSSWEGFHGGWPMQIVRELAPRLPEVFCLSRNWKNAPLGLA
jgi:hypothetical protein